MSYDHMFKNINPTLFDISAIGTDYGIYDENEEFVYPPVLNLTYDDVENTEICFLDDGFNFYLYIVK